MVPYAVFINAPQSQTGLEMHPRGLTASKKAGCKSRLGHIVSNAWCLWIVHESNFCVQAKMNFSTCDHKVCFPKYSHIYIHTDSLLYIFVMLVVTAIFQLENNQQWKNWPPLSASLNCSALQQRSKNPGAPLHRYWVP